MDIIPKNRIRPHTTSRPVIPNGPLVRDNSMTSLSGAPALHVKRHNLTIDPLKDSELTKADIYANSASAAITGRHTTAPVVGQGVSVEELIAKRAGGEKVIDTGDMADIDKPTYVTADVNEEPIKPAAAAEDEAKKPWEEFNQPDEASLASSPQATADSPSGDEDAAAEAARLLSYPEHGSIAELEATHSSSRRSSESEQDTAGTTPEVESSAQENEMSQALAQSSHRADMSKSDGQPDVAAGDSLADALREDEPIAPQEHSQALKDAMQEMDGKPSHANDLKDEKDSIDEKTEGRHQLYEGEPVIVVHKAHGQMSAVAWVLWFIFCLGLALLIVNFLIDAGYIETNYDIPHTNIIGN